MKTSIKVDYIIVGQGLAGTLLSHCLLKRGATVCVFDAGHHEAATLVAAGIINPITGRRLVKSWRVDELLPAATRIYKELETQLHTRLIFKRNILRIFSDIKEENEWNARCSHPDFSKYVNQTPELHEFKGYINEGAGFGEITNAIQVDISGLIAGYRKFLIDKNMLRNTRFQYELLQSSNGEINYKDIKAKKVIFCEGQRARFNPWFEFLPFVISKGEALIVKIPKIRFERILKKKLAIVPYRYDMYWVGSNYEWSPTDSKPSYKGREDISAQLEHVLKTDFEIIDHLAAIRPSVKDRRPVLGNHPKHPDLVIFNGLGTKGTSLGPFFAEQMANFLAHGGQICKEVAVDRFLEKV